MTSIARSPLHATVSCALAALALSFGAAHAQSQNLNLGASGMFDGRPAMAGAQSGLGAMAGPAQGGIGLQGSDGAERGLNLRRPSGFNEFAKPASNTMGAGPDAAATGVGARTAPGDIVKKGDTGIARDRRSSVSKAKRAAKRVGQQRKGVSTIDAQARTGR